MNNILIRRGVDDGVPELRLKPLQEETKRMVDKKVKEFTYEFETIDCLICGSDKSSLVTEKDRYGLYCPVKLCKDCGFLYTSPRMTQRSYNEFYNVEYRRL